MSRFITSILLLSVLLFSAAGCSQLVSSHDNRHSVSSSLGSFLYPNKDSRKDHKPEMPVLKLPVKVGLAFLPSKHWRGQSISVRDQQQLLGKVKAAFGEHEFIERISIIPSTYLRHHQTKGSNGFDTLEQVARLHDVDVMALVSYDQLTQSHQNNASLLYWTIVGMYVIPGNENTIQTFVDTAVFDVKSRKMLMRAPGISKLEKRSTAIDINRVMAEKSRQGFDAAFADMITNLNGELDQFRARAKEGKGVRIEHSAGYVGGGGGSAGLLLLLALLMLFFGRSVLSK